MPILENPRHERFAQLRAGGKTGSDSYRAIAGKDARYADVRADQLMKMPGIRERIESGIVGQVQHVAQSKTCAKAGRARRRHDSLITNRLPYIEGRFWAKVGRLWESPKV